MFDDQPMVYHGLWSVVALFSPGVKFILFKNISIAFPFILCVCNFKFGGTTS